MGRGKRTVLFWNSQTNSIILKGLSLVSNTFFVSQFCRISPFLGTQIPPLQSSLRDAGIPHASPILVESFKVLDLAFLP